MSQVCLSDFVTANEGECWAMGWGFTEKANLHKPVILNELNVTIMNTTHCGVYRDAYNPKLMVCAGSNTGGTYVGDTGGPLMCPYESDPKKFVQNGIITFLVDNDIAPTLYTRISAVQDWIVKYADTKDQTPPRNQFFVAKK